MKFGRLAICGWPRRAAVGTLAAAAACKLSYTLAEPSDEDVGKLLSQVLAAAAADAEAKTNQAETQLRASEAAAKKEAMAADTETKKRRWRWGIKSEPRHELEAAPSWKVLLTCIQRVQSCAAYAISNGVLLITQRLANSRAMMTRRSSVFSWFGVMVTTDDH